MVYVVKQREQRRNVMISARMRAGAAWSDACILNLSSRGMLVRSANAPMRGSYLEIRRGAYVIVARVVWAKSDRFGVQTQDPVPADGLIRNPEGASLQRQPDQVGLADRRAQPRRTETGHEASRTKGRAIEFGVLIGLGAVAAMLMGGLLINALAKPLAKVEASLASSG